MHFETRMNASSLGIKRSKFEVTVGSNVLENAFSEKVLNWISPNF